MTENAELRSAMPVGPLSAGADRFHNPVWIGALNVEDVNLGRRLPLEGGSGFGLARLMIWERDSVRGFVELAITDGGIAPADLTREVSHLPKIPPVDSTAAPIPMTVVVCTRDRASDLATSLASLSEIDYPDFEIVVVDSASTTEATKDVVEGYDFERLRYVRLDRPGLGRARNAAAQVARYDCLAFTDDDTVVDRRWLSALNDGFAAAPDVGCVTGLVASGQLQSPSQHYFDRRVSWARNVNQTVFRLDDPPVGVPLFPFQFGAYGTGANFAIRRSLLDRLGGFDNALGVGTLTGSGEDADLFIRVILDGRAIVYQPNAVVWHRHRVDGDALATQLENYGVGIGAVLAKLAWNRQSRRILRPLVIKGAIHTWRMVRVHDPGTKITSHSGNAFKELRGIIRGPLALRRARRADDLAPRAL